MVEDQSRGKTQEDEQAKTGIDCQKDHDVWRGHDSQEYVYHPKER